MLAWEVEYTDEFGRWWAELSVAQQEAVDTAVEHLQATGPGLGRPWVDTVKGSRHANMKELRPRCGHLRVLFAFDSRRSALLLIGGDKSDRWKAWYAEAIPEADRLYDDHLEALRQEGEMP
ncbi:MAG: type II toxin-antitoxin system RelE/ParE family toxin [Candidatus Dormibacteria bacterium]